MDRLQFDDLVAQIERRYDGRPAALTRHTWSWLLLGYFVVVAATLLLIGGGLLIFVLGALQPVFGVPLILLGVALLTFGIGQAAFLILADQRPPEGRPLSPHEAPELHRLLEEIRTTLECPAVDQVILTSEFNAAVVQHPRLGIFGWSRSWLILGVPLLLAISPQECSAVLAHECTHISLRHGRRANRINRLYWSWNRLFEQLQRNRANPLGYLGGNLMLAFIGWYLPRFHARTFVVSRQQEYQADRMAAGVTSPECAAATLYRIECTATMLQQQFWNSIWNLTPEMSEPPQDISARLLTAFRQAPDADDAARWCDRVLHTLTTNDDTHPCLSERLAAIGAGTEQLHQAGFPQPPGVTAAEQLLGPDCAEAQDWLNSSWQTSVRSEWAERHRRSELVRSLSTDDENAEAPESTDPRELWNQVRQIEKSRNLEAAEPCLRRLLALQPDHVGATYAMGQLRLNQGHADGEELLQHVVRLRSSEWTGPAGHSLEQHLSATGQREQLQELRRRLDAFERDRTAAEEERTKIRAGDRFLPHDLTPSELVLVTETLEAEQHCLNAWLVQKDLQHFPEERLYILCIDSNPRAGSQRASRNDRMLGSLMLKLRLPGRPFIVTPTSEFRSVAGRLMKQDSWRIFQRPAPV